MKEYLNTVFSGKSLNKLEAREAMDTIIRGNVSSEQISAFLGAIRARGESVNEIVGFVHSIMNSAIKIETNQPNHIIDVCGTGGDNNNTFNVSTAVAFVVAGAGIPVAKHGNISVSSKCGSADVLKELGIKIDFSPEKTTEIINATDIAFLFAQLFHPALKAVAPIRKAIGIKTVFNMLGPLCNPAGVKKQIIGVYDTKILDVVAEALLELNCQEAIVVASEDGMDEVSLSAKTQIAHLKKGKVYKYSISPEDFGMNYSSIDQLKGGDSKENAMIIESILNNQSGPKKDIVVVNAAMALQLSGLIDDLKVCVKIAEESISSGKALNKLNLLRSYQ